MARDAALVLGLVAAATLLSRWRLKFAIDARELYKDLYPHAAAEAETEALGWLATAGYSYQALREENAPKVRTMSQLSSVLGVLNGRTDPRLAGRAGGRPKAMVPKPLSPEEIQASPDDDWHRRGPRRFTAATER